jgi:hypothetical protein
VPIFDISRIGFVRRGIQLHARQILSDAENDRRLQGSRDGLANRHIARDYRPIDRRDDGAIAQVGFGEVQGPLVSLDLSVRFAPVGRGSGRVVPGTDSTAPPRRGPEHPPGPFPI